MRFQAGSDLPHFKVANNQTQIRIHFYLKIIRGSSIFYNDSKCSAHTSSRIYELQRRGMHAIGYNFMIALISRKILEAVSVLGPPDGIRQWLVMTFGSVFNLVWGSGLEFSEIRCRFVINICSNINVTFERGANAIKNTVIRLLLPSISDFLIQTGYYIDNHIYFQIKIFYVPTWYQTYFWVIVVDI